MSPKYLIPLSSRGGVWFLFLCLEVECSRSDASWILRLGPKSSATSAWLSAGTFALGTLTPYCEATWRGIIDKAPSWGPRQQPALTTKMWGSFWDGCSPRHHLTAISWETPSENRLAETSWPSELWEITLVNYCCFHMMPSLRWFVLPPEITRK